MRDFPSIISTDSLARTDAVPKTAANTVTKAPAATKANAASKAPAATKANAASKAPTAIKANATAKAKTASKAPAATKANATAKAKTAAKANAALTKVNWYPVRVLFGKINLVKRTLDEADVEYFYPTHIIEKNMKYIEEPLVRSLIFIKTTPTGLREVKMRYSSSLIPYYDHFREDGTKPPVTVPEAQMEMFIRLCRMKEAGLEYLGEDEPKYHLGDRVRVTDGIFKGFEGHIKRIRHDRKLIVTIEGVAAFATRFIPPSMLERVE